MPDSFRSRPGGDTPYFLLQQDVGIKADVLIGSGDVPKVLGQAAKQTNADLLVTGCYPYGGNLRTHGYGIICAVAIPVLNV
jgi:nucleotide-binding universal stress UspA family protein